MWLIMHDHAACYMVLWCGGVGCGVGGGSGGGGGGSK